MPTPPLPTDLQFAPDLVIPPPAPLPDLLTPEGPPPPDEYGFAPDLVIPPAPVPELLGPPPAPPPRPELLRQVPEAPPVDLGAVEERGRILAAADTAPEAAAIANPDLRREALSRLAPTDPRAAYALQAEQAAAIQGRVGTEATAARKTAAERAAEAEEKLRSDMAEAERRRAEATERHAERRAELDELRKTQPALSSRELLGTAVKALGLAIGAGFDRRIDPLAGLKSVEKDISDMAQGHARRLAQQRQAVQEAAGGVEMARDFLADSKADHAMATASIYRDLARELETIQQTATSEVQQLQAGTAAQGALARADQAEATALAAEEEAMIAREEKLAGIALTRAKVAKLGAERAKLERRGTGTLGSPLIRDPQIAKLPAKTQKQIELRGVRGPDGRFVQRPDGSFVLAKKDTEASELNKQMIATGQVVRLANDLIALRAKHGFEWARLDSDAREMMGSKATQLQAALKDKQQLGALDAGSERFLKRLTGGDVAGWYDKRATLQTLVTDSIRDMEGKVRGRTGYTGDLPFTRVTSETPKLTSAGVQDIQTKLQTAYEPRTGTLVPATERMAGIREFREFAKQQMGDARGATQATITEARGQPDDPTSGWIGASRSRLRAIQDDLNAATEAGDTERATKLQAALSEERKFFGRVNAYVRTLDKQLTEETPIKRAGRLRF